MACPVRGFRNPRGEDEKGVSRVVKDCGLGLGGCLLSKFASRSALVSLSLAKVRNDGPRTAVCSSGPLEFTNPSG